MLLRPLQCFLLRFNYLLSLSFGINCFSMNCRCLHIFFNAGSHLVLLELIVFCVVVSPRLGSTFGAVLSLLRIFILRLFLSNFSWKRPLSLRCMRLISLLVFPNGTTCRSGVYLPFLPAVFLLISPFCFGDLFLLLWLIFSRLF